MGWYTRCLPPRTAFLSLSQARNRPY